MRKIAPAILTDNLENLKSKLKEIEGLADWVQIDIADGKFVNNRTISLADLKKVKIPFNLEIHLMTEDPQERFRACQELGAKRVIFHFEAAKNPSLVLEEMKKYDFQRGVAINPATEIEKIKPYLADLESILLLGVTPGFQGREFQPSVLKKIQEIKKISPGVKIGVDGGINPNNIREIANSGADYLVIGSALFGSGDVKENFRLLTEEIKSV